LATLGQNKTYILYFRPLSCRKIVPVPVRGLIFIDATNKFGRLKEMEICSQHNVLHYECIIDRQNYPFQSSAIVRICFEAGIVLMSECFEDQLYD